MDFIKRRVVLDKTLKTLDTTGDGVVDTLTYAPNDKVLQIPLTQTVDDMGIMDIYDDSFVEVISINTIWRDVDFGSIENDFCSKDTVVIGDIWSDTEYTVKPEDSDVLYHCGNSEADNYNPNPEPNSIEVNIDCNILPTPGCCRYTVTEETTVDTGQVLSEEGDGQVNDPLYDPDPDYDRTYFEDPSNNCNTLNTINGVPASSYTTFNTLKTTQLLRVMQRARGRCLELYPNNGGALVSNNFTEVEQLVFDCPTRTKYNYIYRFKCVK